MVRIQTDSEKESVELKEFLLSIVGNAPYGIMAIDLKGDIIMCNTLALQYLDKKINVSQSINKNILELITEFPQITTIIEKNIKRMREPFDLIAAPFKNKFLTVKVRKIVDGSMIVIEDVTEHKQSENKLKKSYEELKTLDELKTRFLAMTSHELKTPITPIIIEVQRLLKGSLGNISGEQRQAIEVLLRNIRRLDKLIGDILDISRIQFNRLQLELQKGNLEIIIKEMIENMEPIANKKKITLVAKIGILPPSIFDPNRIRQILANLIGNAIKFTEKGKITIEAAKQKEHIILKIKDTGQGIAKENLEKIFKPFSQVQPSYAIKQKGIGLGLAICEGIIKAHGGKIWVESTLGKGSIFFVTLPLKANSQVGEAKHISRLKNQKRKAKVKTEIVKGGKNEKENSNS